MSQHFPPDAVEREMLWRFQGGTPYGGEVLCRVQWNQRANPHSAFVALVNVQDRASTAYYRHCEEVEWLIGKLREAMARAWPRSTGRGQHF